MGGFIAHFGATMEGVAACETCLSSRPVTISCISANVGAYAYADSDLLLQEWKLLVIW